MTLSSFCRKYRNGGTMQEGYSNLIATVDLLEIAQVLHDGEISNTEKIEKISKIVNPPNKERGGGFSVIDGNTEV